MNKPIVNVANPTNPHAKEFHIGTINIKDSIPQNLFQITEKNLFQALIYPLTPDQFYESYFAQRALVIKRGSVDRFQHLVKTQMYNLDVREMCENTASDKIHVWFPNKQPI